jgi:aspartyl aminopeptidase
MTPEAVGAYTRLEIEKYGGMIYYSWLDRPLSLAGRIIVRTENGIEARLVNIERDIAAIPSLAIHMNRGVNESCKLNPAVDLLPLVSSKNENSKGSVTSEIAKELSIAKEDIISLYTKGCRASSRSKKKQPHNSALRVGLHKRVGDCLF